jgi:hypothetical protein
MGFHDFDQYERLLTVARKRETDAYLMVLAGRCAWNGGFVGRIPRGPE